MEFPRFVYRKGGPHEMDGGTFDAKIVNTESEFTQATSDGWYDGILDAVADSGTPLPDLTPVEVKPVNEPPTKRRRTGR
jgi:hypothetical protein